MKKIKIIFAILCVFALSSNTVSASQEDFPWSDDYLPTTDAFGKYNPKEYPYYIITYDEVILSYDKIDSYNISYNRKPINLNANDISLKSGLRFEVSRDRTTGKISYANNVISSGLNTGFDAIVFANHDVKNSKGEIVFHAPWVTQDAFRPVGEQMAEVTPIIVGLMTLLMALGVCLALLVRHLRKSARV